MICQPIDYQEALLSQLPQAFQLSQEESATASSTQAAWCLQVFARLSPAVHQRGATLEPPCLDQVTRRREDPERFEPLLQAHEATLQKQIERLRLNGPTWKFAEQTAQSNSRMQAELLLSRSQAPLLSPSYQQLHQSSPGAVRRSQHSGCDHPWRLLLQVPGEVQGACARGTVAAVLVPFLNFRLFLNLFQRFCLTLSE